MVSATYIPMAKLLDVWGRAEGFLLMVGFATLGTILMATSKNLATFCAAEVKQSPPPHSPKAKLSDTKAGLLLHWVCRNHLHSSGARS